jgi:hypothetical protein
MSGELYLWDMMLSSPVKVNWHFASILRVEEYAKKGTSVKQFQYLSHAGFLLGFDLALTLKVVAECSSKMQLTFNGLYSIPFS